ALLPCASPHAITRSGTLFDQASPMIDKRMASEHNPPQIRITHCADRLSAQRGLHEPRHHRCRIGRLVVTVARVGGRGGQLSGNAG
ncbi:hypothetical protein ACIHJG_40730, partial [Streptomyces sp. NPDC052415]|uniref:hypothetical protein n=1 Tax=Streptomyces sp. NPDC052415 TaxID=3365690 RepID=UPI0037D3E9CC